MHRATLRSLRKRLRQVLREWLVCSDQLQRADLLFVLAGRRYRKAHGVQLLRDGWAPELLFSTLSADSLDLSRFAELDLPAWSLLLDLQSHVPSEGRLFFLHYDGASWHAQMLSVGPLGTLTEVAGLARWLREHPAVHSIIIVSSGFHLRRIRMCCRALLPRSVRFYLAAVPQDAVAALGAGDDGLFGEYAKVVLYWIVLAARAAGTRLVGRKE